MPKNILIYLTALFCGMSIMAVELSATKLLAPVYGSTQIVWTIVIGLIMVSLSLGNVLGGRSVDKYNNLNRLYSLLWLASILIAIIGLMGKYIVYLSALALMWVLPNQLIVSGTTLACLLIFSIPLIMLGMASPYLIKLGITDMKDTGKTAGQIYAVSTFGSIIGTLLPTFVTIPTIGTSKTFFVFALTLNLICLYYFLSKKTKIIRSIISAVLIAVCILIPFNDSYAFWKSNLVYEGESLYNYLQVADDGQSVILSTNVAFGVQSIYKKDGSLTGYYYDYALMSPLFMKNANFNKDFKALILGMGTGTYAKQCSKYYPNSKIDGVEIDQKIVDLSKKYFDLTDKEATIFVNDGRTFLTDKTVKKYDLIFVDAYRDITIPFHMSTKEFFSQVKDHLNVGGILMINMNMHSNKNSELNDYLTGTVKAVMNKVYKFDVNNATNSIVIASNDTNCLQYYTENISKIDETNPLYAISQFVKNSVNEIPPSKLVFTDEVAPVEMMGQKVMDEIVGESIVDYKKQLKSSGNGFRDILNYIKD